jgi:hypothetical protein
LWKELWQRVRSSIHQSEVPFLSRLSDMDRIRSELACHLDSSSLKILHSKVTNGQYHGTSTMYVSPKMTTSTIQSTVLLFYIYVDATFKPTYFQLCLQFMLYYHIPCTRTSHNVWVAYALIKQPSRSSPANIMEIICTHTICIIRICVLDASAYITNDENET